MWQTLATFLVAVLFVISFGGCDSSTGSQPIDTDTTTPTDTAVTCEGKQDNPFCTTDVMTNDSTATDTTTNDFCEPFEEVTGDWYNVTPMSDKYGQMATVRYETLAQVCKLFIEGPGAEMVGNDGVFWIPTENPVLPFWQEGTNSFGNTIRIEVGVTDDGRLYQKWYDNDVTVSVSYYSRTAPPSAN